MKRYLILIACVVLQMCLGPIYAWSTFVPRLQADFGYTSWQTQLVFGTAFMTFSITGIFTGRLLDRYGPRVLSVVAGACLGSGYLLASFHGDNFWLLWLGVGCLGGLAISTGYYCPIATAMRWFPERKGLVGGLVIGAYGASTIVLTNLARVMFDHGWMVFDVFRFVSLVYGPIVMVMGVFMHMPPGSRASQSAGFRRRTLLSDRQFWAVVSATLCGTLPGLVVNGNLQPIGLFYGLSAIVALQGITTFAIGSTVGRIVGGFSHDLLGGRRAMVLILSAITLSIVTLIAAGASGQAWLWLPAAMLVGLCYGACFGVFPGQIVDLYGHGVLGTVYALAMLGHGVAGLVGPSLAGWARDRTGSFVPGLIGITVVGLVGLIAFAVLSRRGRGARREEHLSVAESV